MPEEDLVYKVTLDTSAIAGKLDELKNNLDIAFGAGAFSRLAPDTQAFEPTIPQIGMGDRGIDLETLARFLPETSRKFFDTTTETFLTAQDMTTGFTTGINRLMDASRLGFQKFTYGLEMAGLTAGPRAAGIVDGILPDMASKSTIGTGMAALGFGYDPDVAISRGQYQDWARSRLLGERLPGLIGGGGEIGLGIAGLLTGTTAGALGGVGAGLAFSWLVDQSATTWHRDLQRARFTEATSWRFDSGRFTEDQAMALSRRLNEVIQSPRLRLEGIDRQEAETVLYQYTEAGGFDSVRTAEEYADRFKEILEKVQRVRHILHTTLEGATRTMAQWEQMGLLEDAGPLQFAQRLGAQAQVAGFLPSELMALGQQGAAMVQGTGIPLGTGFQGAIDLLTNIKAAQRAGRIPRETLRQLGGPEQAALMLERAGINYGMSPIGTVMAAALFQGMDAEQLPGAGFMGQLQMAGGIFDDPMNYFRFRYQQPQILGQLGAPQLTYLQTLQFAEEMNVMRGALGMTGPIPQEEFAGFLITQGIPWARADLMSRPLSPKLAQTTLNRQIADIRRQQINETHGLWATIKTEMDQFLIQPFRDIFNELSYTWEGIAESDPITWIDEQLLKARGLHRVTPSTLFPVLEGDPELLKLLDYKFDPDIEVEVQMALEPEIGADPLGIYYVGKLESNMGKGLGIGIPDWARDLPSQWQILNAETKKSIAHSSWIRNLTDHQQRMFGNLVKEEFFDISKLTTDVDINKGLDNLQRDALLMRNKVKNLFDTYEDTKYWHTPALISEEFKNALKITEGEANSLRNKYINTINERKDELEDMSLIQQTQYLENLLEGNLFPEIGSSSVANLAIAGMAHLKDESVGFLKNSSLLDMDFTIKVESYTQIRDKAEEALDDLTKKVLKASDGVSNKDLKKLAAALGIPQGPDGLIRKLQGYANLSEKQQRSFSVSLKNQILNNENLKPDDRDEYLKMLDTEHLFSIKVHKILDFNTSRESQLSFELSRQAELKLSQDTLQYSITDDLNYLLKIEGIFTESERDVIEDANMGDPESMGRLISALSGAEERTGILLARPKTKDLSIVLGDIDMAVNERIAQLKQKQSDIELGLQGDIWTEKIKGEKQIELRKVKKERAQLASGALTPSSAIETTIRKAADMGEFISVTGRDVLDDEGKEMIGKMREEAQAILPVLKKLEDLIERVQEQQISLDAFTRELQHNALK